MDRIAHYDEPTSLELQFVFESREVESDSCPNRVEAFVVGRLNQVGKDNGRPLNLTFTSLTRLLLGRVTYPSSTTHRSCASLRQEIF